MEEECQEFHGIYGGPCREERDMAYHQGTVWAFPLGSLLSKAYLKVHQYSDEAVETVKAQLEVMESAMRERLCGTVTGDL